MDFRSLLLKIDESFQDGRFTAQSLALKLDRPNREISNSLRRLHKMGFLNKERTKRPCLTSKGTTCFRGFEYEYKLSKQGSSYVRWLRSGKPIEDATYLALISRVCNHLPEDLSRTIAVIGAARSTYKYKGPMRHLRFLDNDAFPLVHLTLENLNLKNEKAKLNERIIGLENENLRLTYELEKEKSELERLRSELKAMELCQQEMLKESLSSQFDLARSLIDPYLKALIKLRQEKTIIDNLSLNMFILLSKALPHENFNKVREFLKECYIASRAMILQDFPIHK